MQGVSGFGFALVAMSVWVWGLAPQTAAVMAVAGSLAGQLVAAFAVRRTVLWLLTASGAAMLVSAAPRLAAG